MPDDYPFGQTGNRQIDWRILPAESNIFRGMDWRRTLVRRNILNVSNGRRANERIRLMLLHPQMLFRTSLARLLATERDFELVAECAKVAEAQESLADSRPDIILFDFSVWSDLVSKAREADFAGKFLAIAEVVDAGPCVRALSHGISGVVLGCDSPTRLIQAIRVVAGGAAWVDQEVIQFLADRYPHHEDVRLDTLAEREQAVLRGILSGLTNRKIADQIGASESTVKATLQHLFHKTGVRTRSQLVRIMLADEAVHSN
jgi:two-component system nitrate/nitrite response regulator NarL